MASGKYPYVGAAACPIRLRFGTIVKLTGKAALRAKLLGLPMEYVCEDRFANVSREGVDIAIPLYYRDLNNEERIALAKLFGLVRGTVEIYGKQN
jgi:hypothetical protein